MLVYCIKNTVNNKEYIGLTTRTLEKRWKQHIYESNKQNSWEWNTPLGNAIKKYGKDSFQVFVLEECSSETELKQKEIQLIKERKSLASENGYNLSFGGDGRLGYKLSEETKQKISQGNLGKVMSIDAKEKMSVAAKKRCIGKLSPMDGKKHTDDALKKISQSSKGRIFSEESRRKKSESLKAYHLNKKQIELGIINGEHF
jgi:group I intron endonuclease